MLLDIPAVADTDGVATSITWSAANSYTVPASAHQRVPGRVVSGTFTPGEDVVQATTLAQSVVVRYKNGEFLQITGAWAGGVPNKTADYVGGSSGAIFRPTDIPSIAPHNFIYVDPLFGHTYAIQPANQTFRSNGSSSFSFENGFQQQPKQGGSFLYLACVEPTFTVPVWARSWSLKNVSGALLHFRVFRPNVEANVIDTVAATFGEDDIIGQQLADTQVVSFSEGDFSSGASYMLCATAGAANGAIVEFNQ